MSSRVTQGDLTAQLDAVISNMESLVSGLSDTQLLWRPQAGAWSIAECLQHLNETVKAYRHPMRVAFERERQNAPLAPGAFRLGFIARKFISMLEPPYRVKVKAPAAVQPPANLTPSDVIAEFISLRKELRLFITDVSRVDISAIRFPSPFAGVLKLNLAEGFAILSAHDRRHLWQGENVRKHKDFPAA